MIDDAPAHEAKVAGVWGDLDLRDPLDQAVPERGDDALRQRLALAAAPLRVDDLETLPPALDQLPDQLGRVLKVAIDHHDRVAGGGLHPAQGRHRLADPAREAQHLDPPVALSQLGDPQLGAVGARVDGEDQLPVQTEGLDHLAQPLVHAGDVVLLVVGGNDDAEQLSAAVAAHLPSASTGRLSTVRPRIPNGSLMPRRSRVRSSRQAAAPAAESWVLAMSRSTRCSSAASRRWS